MNDTEEPQPVACRTGFAIVDVETGESDWHALPAFTDPEYSRPFGSGEWLRFNNDGTLVYEFINMAPGRIFRDLRGKEVPAPPKEKHVDLIMAPAASPRTANSSRGPSRAERVRRRPRSSTRRPASARPSSRARNSSSGRTTSV